MLPGGQGSLLTNSSIKSKQNRSQPGDPEQVDQLVKAIKLHKGARSDSDMHTP